MLNFKFIKAGLISLVTLSMLNSALADDIKVEVEEDNAPSYSGSTSSQGNSQGNFRREESIDVARELTITKSAPYSFYKLPQLPQYTPKPLLEDAKGIAVIVGIPFNCKILGEAEGIDSSDGKSAPSFEIIREGALNDLRNKTLDLVDTRDRVVLIPIKEAMTCELKVEGGDQFEEKDCTQWTTIPSNGKILYYRIHANVFNCGPR